MDPSLNKSVPEIEEDEWDTDGFVIPSLTIGDSEHSTSLPEAADPKPHTEIIKEPEKIYLGPHGAPPSQTRQQDFNTANRRQRFKTKLREADHKFSGSGRENKVETIRQLVGSKVSSTSTMPKTSARDWLDPHCHESQFERSRH